MLGGFYSLFYMIRKEYYHYRISTSRINIEIHEFSWDRDLLLELEGLDIYVDPKVHHKINQGRYLAAESERGGLTKAFGTTHLLIEEGQVVALILRLKPGMEDSKPEFEDW